VTVARVLHLIGFFLNFTGVLVSSASFVTTWLTYGREPLVPQVANAIVRLRSVFRRSAKVHLTAVQAGGVVASMRVHATVRQGFPDEISIEEKLARLIRGYKALGEEIEANRSEADSSDQALTDRLTKLDDKWTQDQARLEAMARDIAIGDVRPQLAGLALVIVGTTLSLWATFLSS
jgi:hypothetical protein